MEKCFQSWYGQSIVWHAFSVASYDNLAKYWCGKDKVGVTLATPAILRFTCMVVGLVGNARVPGGGLLSNSVI